MQARREQERIGRHPRLTVVRGELRARRSSVSRERGRRLPAHPLEFDERGFPIEQPRLTVAERLARLLTS